MAVRPRGMIGLVMLVLVLASARRASAALSGDMVRLPGGISLQFALVPAGTFQMGSPEGESGRDSDETQHQVTLTRDFLMQTTEVTQAHWRRVMGKDPVDLTFKGCGDCPVESVNWFEAVAYANALSRKEGRTESYMLKGCKGEIGGADFRCDDVKLTARSPYETTGWRLPTEAEWEYAYRDGSSTAWYFGSDSKLLGTYAWFDGNSGSTTHPVAQKQPNARGLYDMAGNVWEWCWDWYGSYPGMATNPVGNGGGSYRVLRGGSWSRDASYARAAGRDYNSPGLRNFYIGFRLARSRP